MPGYTHFLAVFSPWLLFVCLCGLPLSKAYAQSMYMGLFAGYGSARSAELEQQGAVLLNPRLHLPIKATGPTNQSSLGMGGLQLGYEWSRLGSQAHRWAVRPALELEAMYLGKHSPVGDMPVRPRALGTQYVTIPMTTGVVLANAVFTLETPYSRTLFPYVGLGAGAAFMSIKGADSANPSEPGINHFNSDPNASGTAFALQLKLGLKAQVQENVHVFAEYRHLSISPSSYTFGETDYPGVHLPTRKWDVSLGRQKYNFFVVGLQYRF
jgi:hypothetical protein